MPRRPRGYARAGCRDRPAAGRLIDREAELGGDHDLSRIGAQRLADEFLVGERAIDFGGVEEGDAAFDRRADQVDLPRVRFCIAHLLAPSARWFRMSPR
jgi:hypothetical protein